MDQVLEVRGLKTYFYTESGVAKSVDGVDFALGRGRTLGIVGESGSGKSVTSLSVMRLVEESVGRIVGGEIRFEGESLLDKSEKEMRAIRGNRISMIFQEPMTSLNPVFTIGMQIGEVLKLHQGMSSAEAARKCVELLKLVGIPLPEQRVREYPHQLSGGMRQRVMIAMALACNPALLIADEPTTALDVTIQAQILELMKELKERLGTAIMLITHDLGVVAEVADEVMVLYAGKVVEHGAVEDIFRSPMHPYTRGLLASIPDIDAEVETLETIEGLVPSVYDMPPGCRFAPRCKHAMERCLRSQPALVETAGHKTRCFLYGDASEEEAG
ncbi:ABC transporter ATP-binding protein [Cohnella fermenti]|uniref:ABC transporter ATP-binding protein n=1 Tax=Cohnella fermenti TaxID=2565925 RepID=A0A4S4CEX9_9BACL|nr:ABC transporter ATP-binding protein [Cohnella fermenti]THF84565.1 ABC transporter ATP-binding protein [Cohnella fermenti]